MSFNFFIRSEDEEQVQDARHATAEEDSHNPILNAEEPRPTTEVIQSNGHPASENSRLVAEEFMQVTSDPAAEETMSDFQVDNLPRWDISMIFDSDKNGCWTRSMNKLNRLSDSDRVHLLTSHFMPNSSFQWPFHQRKKQKVYLSMSHISGKFDCYKYSFQLKGLLCVPCCLFAGDSVSNDRGKEQQTGKLVIKPFTNYNTLYSKLNGHAACEYHKTAQKRAEEFLCMTKSSMNIVKLIDSTVNSQAKDNRERLVPIIKTV